MTREDIMRMAREAGGRQIEVYWDMTIFVLERFAALVAKHEREACAKVVEDYCGAWDDEGHALAAAIRARGDQ